MRTCLHRRRIRIAICTFLLPIGIGLGLFANSVVSHGQQSDAVAEFRELHADLRQRMDQDLTDAAEYLESKIIAAPDSADLNLLRHTLATRFMQERQFKNANAEFQKLLDFQIKHADDSENQFGMWMTVQSMQKIAAESGDDDLLRPAVRDALDALQAIPGDDDLSLLFPVSQLSALRAKMMVGEGETEAATKLVDNQLSTLEEVNRSPRATEETVQAQVRMLRSLVSADRENDSWRDEFVSRLDETVSSAIARFPNSIPLQSSYAEVQLMMITRWGQDDPEATKERMDTVSKQLILFATRNRSVQAIMRRIEVQQERMSAAKPVASLVGNPAPKWDIDAWVNSPTLTRESFQGDVVLLDFWAMWCGPCIATFPQLRQWREEFGEDGFEIIGVTKYYNFKWDEHNERAERSTDPVGPQEERETLAKFLEHHELRHPVLVTPEDSEMASEYGVRGIPHVVLIDREGIVQLVRTGAGEKGAAEIHAKIKELVQTKVEN